MNSPINREFLENLKKKLPSNAATAIQQRLKEKLGREYDKSHITRTLSNPPIRIPNKIIDEAILLADEHQLYLEHLKEM